MIDNVGKELKRLRNLAGLSLTQVTVRTELSGNYVSKLENGARSNPSPEVIRKLAGAYGVGYLWLMEHLGVIEPDEIREYYRSVSADLDFNPADDAALSLVALQTAAD